MYSGFEHCKSDESLRGAYSNVKIGNLHLLFWIVALEYWCPSFSFKWSIFQATLGSQCQLHTKQLAEKEVFDNTIHSHKKHTCSTRWDAVTNLVVPDRGRCSWATGLAEEAHTITNRGRLIFIRSDADVIGHKFWEQKNKRNHYWLVKNVYARLLPKVIQNLNPMTRVYFQYTGTCNVLRKSLTLHF